MLGRMRGCYSRQPVANYFKKDCGDAGVVASPNVHRTVGPVRVFHDGLKLSLDKDGQAVDWWGTDLRGTEVGSVQEGNGSDSMSLRKQKELDPRQR